MVVSWVPPKEGLMHKHNTSSLLRWLGAVLSAIILLSNLWTSPAALAKDEDSDKPTSYDNFDEDPPTEWDASQLRDNVRSYTETQRLEVASLLTKRVWDKLKEKNEPLTSQLRFLTTDIFFGVLFLRDVRKSAPEGTKFYPFNILIRADTPPPYTYYQELLDTLAFVFQDATAVENYGFFEGKLAYYRHVPPNVADPLVTFGLLAYHPPFPKINGRRVTHEQVIGTILNDPRNRKLLAANEHKFNLFFVPGSVDLRELNELGKRVDLTLNGRTLCEEMFMPQNKILHH